MFTTKSLEKVKLEARIHEVRKQNYQLMKEGLIEEAIAQQEGELTELLDKLLTIK